MSEGNLRTFAWTSPIHSRRDAGPGLMADAEDPLPPRYPFMRSIAPNVRHTRVLMVVLAIVAGILAVSTLVSLGMGGRTSSVTERASSPRTNECEVVSVCRNCRRFLLVASDSSGDLGQPVAGEHVWLAGVARMLLGPFGKNTVHVLTPVALPSDNAPALSQLQKPGITVLRPFETRQCPFVGETSGLPPSAGELRHVRGRVLTAAKLCVITEMLTRTFSYDAVIVRDDPQVGYAAEMLRSSQLVHRLVVFGLQRPKELDWASIVPLGAYQAVISPTSFENGQYTPERDGVQKHVVWLPPMIPELTESIREEPGNGRTICYIGSFPRSEHDYMIREMVLGFRKVRETISDAKFVAIFTGFEHADTETRNLLSETQSLSVARPVSHDEALAMYRERCDVGVRGLRGDDRNVLSAKVLEMASVGLPVILNPQRVHSILLGDDYPLYWQHEDSINSFARVAVSILSDDRLYHSVSQRLVNAANRFTYDAIYSMITRVLPRTLRLFILVGVRPNLMKAAPVVHAVQKLQPTWEVKLIHSGQHYSSKLSDVFFQELGLPPPDIHLGVGAGSIVEQMANVMLGLDKHLRNDSWADAAMVVGDVTSTIAGAIAFQRLGIPVVHLEAGLRCGDRALPEEVNRIETDAIAELHLVTERAGMDHLKEEGITKAVYLVGNCMIDTLMRHKDKAMSLHPYRKWNLEPEKYVVATFHRGGNVDTDSQLRKVLQSMFNIAQTVAPVLFTVHPRTYNRMQKTGMLDRFNHERLHYLDPLPYVEFVGLVAHAGLVLTDSGGLEEEATVMKVPCMTVRTTTERPVTITHGTNILVPLDPTIIAAKAQRALDRDWTIPTEVPEFWEGNAAERVVQALRHWQFGKELGEETTLVTL